MNNYTIGQKLHRIKTDRSTFFVKEIYDRSKVTQNQNRSIKLFCKRNLRSVKSYTEPNRSIKIFCKRNLRSVKSYTEPKPIGHIFFKRNLRSVNITQKTLPNSIDHCIILKDKVIDRFLWLIVKINLYKKKKKT
jgi:hypothetical protein